MVDKIPDIDDDAVKTVKETCAILKVSRTTLTARRKAGRIKPVNTNPRRFKYSGYAIKRLWKLEHPKVNFLNKR